MKARRRISTTIVALLSLTCLFAASSASADIWVEHDASGTRLHNWGSPDLLNSDSLASDDMTIVGSLGGTVTCSDFFLWAFGEDEATELTVFDMQSESCQTGGLPAKVRATPCTGDIGIAQTAAPFHGIWSFGEPKNCSPSLIEIKVYNPKNLSQVICTITSGDGGPKETIYLDNDAYNPARFLGHQHGITVDAELSGIKYSRSGSHCASGSGTLSMDFTTELYH